MTIPPDRIAGWLSRLVQIPSINPDAGDFQAVPDHLGEGRLADFLTDHFRELGGEVVREEVFPGRPNVYSMWLGRSGQWVAVDVHTDTVGVSNMTDPPFDGRIEAGRVWGRGAVDTKASLAILLALLEEAHRRGRPLHHNLLVVGSVSEEVGGHGATAFAAWARARGLVLDQLLVAEPTGCAPVYAHKGVMLMRFTVHGQAAHSSKPDLGRNAIQAALPAVAALQAEHEHLQKVPAETPLGPATLAVTLIEGGSGHNIVPASCSFTLNRRLVPGEDPEAVLDHLEQIVREACPLPISREEGRGLAAFYQSPDSPWLNEMTAWSGVEPEVVPFGTNALAYPGLARETVIFGPGSIEQAHGPVEWVEIDQLARATSVYEDWLLPE